MMHEYTPEIDSLADDVLAYAKERVSLEPTPMGRSASAKELFDALGGPTITEDGIGSERALRAFTDVLAPACLSVDNTRYLSFVPAAPTEAAILFDLVVGAESIYGGSWLEGAGAAYAENEALRWLCDLAGLDESSGGVFVQGGTIGNLSALVGARGYARARLDRLGRPHPERWAFLVSDTAHSSVPSAAMVMDAEAIPVATGPRRRLTGPMVAEAIEKHGDRVAGVVATAGSTNLGIIDDLRSVGDACHERDIFFHVDAAYGGAAMAAPSARHLFDGIETADSVIIDPHKWLFAPFDCCALLWRDPDQARAVHSQHAEYLEFLDIYGDWNPSDFAIQLTRRPRGLPFWFSLASYGTREYGDAVERTLELAAEAAAKIKSSEHLRLVWEPGLSIVVFERIGWEESEYQACTERMIADGTGFVVPSRHDGKPVFRFCFINPRTTSAEIDAILAAMK